MNPLPFHRANHAEPDGRADLAAQLGEDKEPGRGFRFESQQPTDRPEDRRKVTGPLTFLNQGSQCTQLLPAEAAFGRRQQRSALPSTGAVSNMIGRERIAEFIQFAELPRLEVTGVNEGQRRVQTVGKYLAAARLAMLPGGFESARVREATGGKPGVSKLPEEKLAGGAALSGKCFAHDSEKIIPCANGNTLAGSHFKSSPSAVTS